ncbi:hypothetical protein LQV05_002799 [Cryptococcus neoformans]|nr:hypothetical protein LQV05_002799 [Cryptococcus neoformans]
MPHPTGPYQRQLYWPNTTASPGNAHNAHPSPYHPPPISHHRSPQYHPPISYSPSQSSPQAAIAAQALRSRGNEYLLSLTTSVNNLQLHDGVKLNDRPSQVPDHFSKTHRAAPRPSSASPNCNKQLPPLPRPDIVPPNHHNAGLPNVTAFSQGSFPSQTIPAVESLHSGQASGFEVSRDDKGPAVVERPTSNTYRNVDLSLSVINEPMFSKTPPHARLPVKASVNGKGIKATPANNKEEINSSSKSSAPKNKSLQTSQSFSTPEDAQRDSVIDLTQISDSSASPPSGLAKENVTPRSSTTPMKATPDLRHSFLTSPSPLSTSAAGRGSSNTPSSISPSKTKKSNSPHKPYTSNSSSVQCSGFTRTGQPCKRLVRVKAPYLSAPDALMALDEDGGDARSEKVMGRYCKDHAGMICTIKGFYWRRERDSSGVWIEFDDYIPQALGQQTQTLLRMTMETKLTPKECAGFLYAYELKDLETSELSFYKVGRTDNVPRRIGQWTNQCQSKRPILLDIFPRPSGRPRHDVTSSLHRSDTLTTSFLPGATTHRTPPLLAMKRWERLVHLELSERCVSHPLSEQAYERSNASKGGGNS